MECGSWLHKANVGAFPSVYDPSLGILRTHQNCTVESVHIALPALRKLFLNAELAFDGEPYTAWAEQKWNDGTLLWICAAYLALCFALRPMLMAAKIRYRLQKELIVWNLLLAAFSLAGALRLVPHLLYLIGSRGFYGSVSALLRMRACSLFSHVPFFDPVYQGSIPHQCTDTTTIIPLPPLTALQLCAPATPACGSGPAGVWVMLFVFSKIPELMDTVFIVLRGKPLIFLHWWVGTQHTAYRMPRWI